MRLRMTMSKLLEEIPKCCASCEFLYNKNTDEPCYSCVRYDAWKPNSYLRHLADIKENNKNG